VKRRRRRRVKNVRGVGNRPWARDDIYMRRYEERIIMRDVEAMTAGGNREVSSRRLRLFAPMRYSRHLQAALKRLQQQGRLRVTGRSRFESGYIYAPVEDPTTISRQEAA
jgi:hypothetical protein